MVCERDEDVASARPGDVRPSGECSPRGGKTGGPELAGDCDCSGDPLMRSHMMCRSWERVEDVRSSLGSKFSASSRSRNNN